MTGPHGFIPVEIGTLRKATEAWFRVRDARIAQERNEMIALLMAPARRRWSWSRWRFETYHVTRDEAVKWLKTHDDWQKPAVRGGADAEHIAEVGVSVRHIRHPHNWVYLSTRTVALLAAQLVEPQ
jgi:hypothetical protein